MILNPLEYIGPNPMLPCRVPDQASASSALCAEISYDCTIPSATFKRELMNNKMQKLESWPPSSRSSRDDDMSSIAVILRFHIFTIHSTLSKSFQDKIDISLGSFCQLTHRIPLSQWIGRVFLFMGRCWNSGEDFNPSIPRGPEVTWTSVGMMTFSIDENKKTFRGSKPPTR